MRKLLLLIAILCSPAFGAAVSFRAATGGYANNATTVVLSLTPTASTDDVIFTLHTFTSGAVSDLTGCSITAGSGTLIADSALAASGSYGYGFYRIHNAGTSALDVQCTFSVAVEAYTRLIDVTTVGSFGGVSTAASGSSVSAVATSPGTPASNGAFFVTLVGVGVADTFSNWTAGSVTLTALSTRTTGPTAGAGYYAQATAASVTGGATLGTSASWGAITAYYLAPAVSSCTHSGITLISGGAIAVPNGSTGSYRLKNGSSVTPDCATVNYMQPTLGNFGVN